MADVRSIVTVGASGLIGGAVLSECRRRGFQCGGTYRNVAVPGLFQFDSSSPESLAPLLGRMQPDAVVYAGGWTWVDGCETQPERALRENSTEPAAVARLCSQRGIHFTYLSTSYVFDGAEGGYAEDAAPNPINVYGRAKLDGEMRIAEATRGDALIARVICVYGPELQRKNFAYQVWRALEEGRELVVPTDQLGNPTSAADIARWLLMLVTQRVAGIRHLPGPDPGCSRPEWARQLVEAFKACGVASGSGFRITEKLTSELNQPAPRPLRAGIISRYSFDAPTALTTVVRRMVGRVDR